jgi:hypothetical protein
MTLRFIAYPDVFCSTACQPNAGAGMATFEPAYPQTSTQIHGVTLTADRVLWVQLPRLQSANTKSFFPMKI